MFNPTEHLIQLKGKDYLQVAWRLVWFRDEKPLWGIETHLENLTEDHAVFSAKIVDENGIQKSSGYGSESQRDFGDFIEKAETKAVGRALAMLGYGTQFAPELDEGERIVDSPIARKGTKKKADTVEFVDGVCDNCGKDIVDKGNWSASDIVTYSKRRFEGKVLCPDCQKIAMKGENW